MTGSIGHASNCKTLGELAHYGMAALALTSESPTLDAELLLARIAQCERSIIRAFPERAVDPSAAAAFEHLIERRRRGEPIAYLLGEREFYSLPMHVKSGVLVPRPETELLVDIALSYLSADTTEAVLDLGTGSGAIALAIKHERRNARVVGVDVSVDALAVARANVAALGLDVELVASNWFDALGERRFALIVANPPYVESGDLALGDALRHEPRFALDGGPDGLVAVRAILRLAPAHLLEGGRLLIEHGETQGLHVRQLAAACGYTTIRTLKDLAGRDRVLVAARPE
jgi:release factor glutamine methyltransferase